jgi:hypothetical protein
MFNVICMFFSSMEIIRDSYSELVFAHRTWPGLVIAAASALLAYYVWWHSGIEDVGLKKLMLVFCGAAFAVGALAYLWRYSIHINLNSRTYKASRGFSPLVKNWHGTLDELEGVVLTSKEVNGKDGRYTVWDVSLEFRGQTSKRVYYTKSEPDAYCKLEHLTRRLKTTAIDRTGPETRRSWEQLDEKIIDLEGITAQADKRFSTIGKPRYESVPVSTVSNIRSDHFSSQGKEILLPRLKMNIGRLMFILLGVLYLSVFSYIIGSFFLSDIDVIGRDEFTSPEFCFLIAAWGMVLPFAIISIRRYVCIEGGYLVYGRMFLGRKMHSNRLPCHEIEEVSIKKARYRMFMQRFEVLVRSDKGSLRIGIGLDVDTLQWLSDEIVRLIRS